MKVCFEPKGWADYQHWVATDRDILLRLNALIEGARRSPFTGPGKPEPLNGDLSGWWSRRITGENRLVYRLTGKPGEDQRIDIVLCGFYYT